MHLKWTLLFISLVAGIHNFLAPRSDLSPPPLPGRHASHSPVQIWLLDSGAETHASFHKEAFTSFTGEGLTTGVTGSAKVHLGSINIQLGGQKITLDNAIFFPQKFAAGSQYGIISLGRLARDFGMYGEWSANGITIRSKRGKMLAKAKQQNDLFWLYLE